MRHKTLKASGVFLTMVLCMVVADVYWKKKVPTAVVPHVPLEGRRPLPAEVYEFRNRALVLVPEQSRASMVFLTPRPGDLLVLFLPGTRGRRGGCYEAVQVGGTIVLTPSPKCGAR